MHEQISPSCERRNGIRKERREEWRRKETQREERKHKTRFFPCQRIISVYAENFLRYLKCKLFGVREGEKEISSLNFPSPSRHPSSSIASSIIESINRLPIIRPLISIWLTFLFICIACSFLRDLMWIKLLIQQCMFSIAAEELSWFVKS